MYIILIPERFSLYILTSLISLLSLFSPIAGEGFTCLDHSMLSKKKRFWLSNCYVVDVPMNVISPYRLALCGWNVSLGESHSGIFQGERCIPLVLEDRAWWIVETVGPSKSSCLQGSSPYGSETPSSIVCSGVAAVKNGDEDVHKTRVTLSEEYAEWEDISGYQFFARSDGFGEKLQVLSGSSSCERFCMATESDDECEVEPNDWYSVVEKSEVREAASGSKGEGGPSQVEEAPQEEFLDVDEYDGEPDLGDEQLAKHVCQGHFPYLKKCSVCHRTRGVSPGRKVKPDGAWSLGIDFAFFGKFRYLLLVSFLSGMIGCIPWSEDRSVNLGSFNSVLSELGALGQAVEIVSDQEPLLRKVVVDAAKLPSWVPKSAHFRPAPVGRPQAKGTVERSIRSFKEGVRANVLGLEEKLGQRIAFGSQLFDWACVYSCRMYNRHHQSQGTLTSPLDRQRGVCEGKRPSGCPFSCIVHLETGRANRGLARFVEGMYLSPVLTQGGGHYGVVKGEVVRGKTVRMFVPFRFGLEHVEGWFEAGEGRVPLGDGPSDVGEGGVEVPLQEVEEPSRDFWEYDMDRDAWARRRVVPRKQLFLPTGDELPFNANLVKDIRVTEYRFEHGPVRELEDMWRDPACANRSLEQSWTGSTYFFSTKKPSQDSQVEMPPSWVPKPEDLDLDRAKKHGPPWQFVEAYGGTRGCVSCSSRMNCPGCRHSQKCKSRYLDFVQRELSKAGSNLRSEGDVPSPSVLFEGEVEEVPVPVPSEVSQVPVESNVPPAASEPKPESGEPSKKRVLEVEDDAVSLPRSKEPRLQSVRHDDLLNDVCETFLRKMMRCVPLFKGQETKQVKWGSQTVDVTLPSGGVCDLTGEVLPRKEVQEGILTEVTALAGLEVGDVIAESEGRALCKRKNLKMIPTRWVVTRKAPGLARCRMVAKDFKTSDTALSLGLYAPTSTVELLRLVLATAVAFGMCLATCDISTAFLNAEVIGEVYVLLPPEITLAGVRAAARPRRALYGLRSAPVAWFRTLALFFKDLGVHSCGAEPTVLQGVVEHNVRGESWKSRLIVMLYVDDLLFAGSTVEVIEHVK